MLSKRPITKATIEGLPALDRDQFLWDAGDGALKGFGVKKTAKGRVTYIFQYRLGGRGVPTKRIQIGEFPHMPVAEARAAADELRQGVRKGTPPGTTRSRNKAKLVRGLVEMYVASQRANQKRSTGEIERLLNKHVLPEWGGRPISSITDDEVSALVGAIHRAKKPALANRVLAWIKGMFTYAVANKLIVASPAHNVEPPAPETERDRVLTDAELTEIWRAAAKLAGPFGYATQTLMLTGQRRSEVAGIRPDEITAARKLWELPADRAKNKQAHTIHLSELAIATLGAVPRTSKAYWFSTDGENPIQGWSRWKDRIDAAILEARQDRAKASGATDEDLAAIKAMAHWTIHDLRRTMATRLNELGFPEHVVDLILNHRNKAASARSAVRKVYNRALYLPERKAALEAWGEYVRNLVSPSGKEIAA